MLITLLIEIIFIYNYKYIFINFKYIQSFSHTLLAYLFVHIIQMIFKKEGWKYFQVIASWQKY
jgi:hypothetical protein